MEEKRQLILCSCGKEMVFTRKITPPAEDFFLAGLMYRCPTREGEGGCGAIREILLDIREMRVLFSS